MQPRVNSAVINSLNNGSYSTLNAHEEVELADKTNPSPSSHGNGKIRKNWRRG